MTGNNTIIYPFEIKDCALIAIATGKRAQNLRELKEYISLISSDSIYYHFWGSLLRPRFDDPEYHNDFAIWAAHSLHDKVLAERLAVVDPTEFNTLEELRNEIIEIIEERLDEVDYPLWARRDSQFEFIRSQIVIFNTQRKVDHPSDFVEAIPSMSVGSIFYHFIDSRRRLSTSIDDFRNWLMNFGEEYQELRRQISGIDPYFLPLTKLRAELTKVFSSFVKGERK
jgi:hypothetical protein